MLFLQERLYIGESLRNYGEYSPDETEFIINLARKEGKDKTVIDIGANIGAISQALEVSGVNVVAFEPQPEVFKLLKMNFKGEGHNVALGEKARKASMPSLRYDTRSNFGGAPCDKRSQLYGAVRVEMRPLDDYKFENVGVMKIDVEGYEVRVLLGAVETIERCGPVLYMEDNQEEHRESLYKVLRDLGYRWEPHRPALFRENNFLNKKENIWNRRYVSSNIVCYR